MNTTATGGCLCGEVRYQTTGDLRDVVNCHCERCRRVTGHFMAATGCNRAQLAIDERGTLRWFEAGPGVFYGFCGRCGSTLFWRADGRPEWISIAAGTLDQPSGLTTTAAWWTSEVADYHQLDGTIVNYAYEDD